MDGQEAVQEQSTEEMIPEGTLATGDVVDDVTEEEVLTDADILETPELVQPPAKPDAHQGLIAGIEFNEFESGAAALKVSLHSQNTGIDDSLLVFLPKAFVENINLTAAEAQALPTEKGNNQAWSYAGHIANSTKTATIQVLRLIAREQGRSLVGKQRPANVLEYTALLNELCTGVECVFTRRPDKSNDNPAFAGRLRVSSILSPEIANDPKALKKYRKMWESQE